MIVGLEGVPRANAASPDTGRLFQVSGEFAKSGAVVDLPATDANVRVKREPRLNPRMHTGEFRIDAVVVNRQAGPQRAVKQQSVKAGYDTLDYFLKLGR